MKKYCVYECVMALVDYDGRYEEMRENENAEIVGEVFDTIEEANAFLDGIAAAWDFDYKIVRTSCHYLDTIIYNAAYIVEEEYEDGDVVDCSDIRHISSLPDDVIDAAMMHQARHWTHFKMGK